MSRPKSNIVWPEVMFGVVCALCVGFVLRVGGKPAIGEQVYLGKDYFSHAEGSQWVYKTQVAGQDFIQRFYNAGREEINGVSMVKYFFSETGYKAFGVSTDGLVKYKEYEDGVTELFDPPGIILPNLQLYKLQEYDSVYIEYDANGQRRSTVTGRFQIKLTGIETVHTPAGRFDNCLRIEYIDRWTESNGDFDSTRGVIWWAPGVGRVKDISRITEFDSGEDETEKFVEVSELVSFEP